MSDSTDKIFAFSELDRLAQPDVEPVIYLPELERILERHKRAQRWPASTVLVLGTVVMPTVRMGRIYKVTTEGTTGATEPSWTDDDEAEVTSGTVVFTEAGVDFENIYDIRAAVQEAWALKAAKMSDGYLDGEESIFKQCKEMAQMSCKPLIA